MIQKQVVDIPYKGKALTTMSESIVDQLIVSGAPIKWKRRPKFGRPAKPGTHYVFKQPVYREVWSGLEDSEHPPRSTRFWWFTEVEPASGQLSSEPLAVS